MVLGIPRVNVLKFITYLYGVQIMHAKARWNPLSIANKMYPKKKL